MKKEELKCFICGQALESVDDSTQKEHMDYDRYNDRPFFNVCRECQQLIDKCLKKIYQTKKRKELKHV